MSKEGKGQPKENTKIDHLVCKAILNNKYTSLDSKGSSQSIEECHSNMDPKGRQKYKSKEEFQTTTTKEDENKGKDE